MSVILCTNPLSFKLSLFIPRSFPCGVTHYLVSRCCGALDSTAAVAGYDINAPYFRANSHST